MYRLIGAALGLTAACALLVAAVSAAAPALTPPSVAEQMLSAARFDCSQPCLQGIAPGVTTLEQLETLLENNPLVQPGSIAYQAPEQEGGVGYMRCNLTGPYRYHRNYWGWIEANVQDGTVTRLEFGLQRDFLRDDFRLGDALAVFGRPELCKLVGPDTVVIIYPRSGALVVAATDDYRPLPLSPGWRIVMVEYRALDLAFEIAELSMSWHGCARTSYVHVP
ncbi:MAG: hypothetical protein JXB47_15340 [Anaerolineae bacterium]|nr:hypothetical protein [Anaerolineae bacterium]